MTLKILTAFLMVTVASLIINVSPVFAADDPFKGVDCRGIGGANQNSPNESAVCSSKTNKDPLVGEGGVLINIGNIVAYVAGAGAIIMIVYGSIQFITASGDTDKVKTARRTVVYSLIGLVVIFMAHALIVYVIKQLG